MSYNPDVQITEVTKKGEWYTVKGRTKDGRSGSVDIPAASVETQSRDKAEAMMRRGILGTVDSEK